MICFCKAACNYLTSSINVFTCSQSVFNSGHFNVNIKIFFIKLTRQPKFLIGEINNLPWNCKKLALGLCRHKFAKLSVSQLLGLDWKHIFSLLHTFLIQNQPLMDRPINFQQPWTTMDMILTDSQSQVTTDWCYICIIINLW